MELFNAYQDTVRAESYAKLEFPNTYYLAFRDLPLIFAKYITGKNALDFGCGTGRSTRFLKKHKFVAKGVDIAIDMLEIAHKLDSSGEYHLIDDADLTIFNKKSFDLILSTFTFDNIPTMKRKVKIFKAMTSVLNDTGKIINLVSSPELYVNEWASFTTKDFPENRVAKSGDIVKTITTTVDDQRPVEDIIWSDKDYRKAYQEAGLEVEAIYNPLAREDEPFDWINETTIAPWTIYVLKKNNVHKTKNPD